MTKRTPFGTHRLLDCEPDVALIRYDGDPDVFTALAWAWLMDEESESESGHYAVEPPRPRLYRFNPTDDPDYSWLLGRPSKPGPGVFTGALLERGRSFRCGYCFAAAPEHEDDCVTLRRFSHAFRSLNGGARCVAIVGQLGSGQACGLSAAAHQRPAYSSPTVGGDS